MKHIKQLIVWALFYTGHLTCVVGVYQRFEWGYGLYQWAMVNSDRLQQKWGLPKPWGDAG